MSEPLCTPDSYSHLFLYDHLALKAPFEFVFREATHQKNALRKLVEKTGLVVHQNLILIHVSKGKIAMCGCGYRYFKQKLIMN